MKDGPLRRFYFTELDPKKAARERGDWSEAARCRWLEGFAPAMTGRSLGVGE